MNGIDNTFSSVGNRTFPVDPILPSLLTDQMSSSEKEEITNYISDIPDQDRDSVITHSLRLITDRMNGSERLAIITDVRNIPVQNRDALITDTLRLITDQMNALERRLVIFGVKQIPNQERDSVIILALSLITEPNGFQIFEILIHLVIQAGFLVDSAQLFDEERNPTTPHIPLIKLFALIGTEHPFPKIRYMGSPGVDQGGLTRDFVTSLMNALCHPNQKHWKMIENIEGYLPLISKDSKLSEWKQLQCCKSIGAIFALAIQEDHVNIGRHFHPTLYKMIHSLTEEEIYMKDLAQSNPHQKLIKIFLHNHYPNIFQEISNEELDNFIATGKLSQTLIDKSIDENFFNDYVTGPVQAALQIAQTLRYRTVKSDWQSIKGESPEVLQIRIEGAFTKEMVIDAFKANLLSETRQAQGEFLKQWIEESSENEVQRFLFAILGSETLSSNTQLDIQIINGWTDQHAIAMHTCSGIMDMPSYTTYEAFKKGLETSIENAFFQIRFGFE